MRTPLEVADVFRRHGDAYRQAHDGHIGSVERKVMGAIEACRTAALGGHVESCADCGFTRQAYNSCRNRHCPKCQGLARAEWLAERQAELLPTQYFHVVFTMPPPIAEIAFQNKAIVYGVLFKAAAETLRTIAADPKHLGAEIGLVAVLHTWGQNLHHHRLNPLRRSRRRPVAGRNTLGLLPARLLPPRACAIAPLSTALPRKPTSRLRGRRARLLRRPRPSQGARRLRSAHRADAPDRMGRLRQAAVRRPRAGSGLSGPLHPPRRVSPTAASSTSTTIRSPFAGRTTAITTRPRS